MTRNDARALRTCRARTVGSESSSGDVVTVTAYLTCVSSSQPSGSLTMDNSSQRVVGVPLAQHQRRPWTRYVAIGDSLSEGIGDPLPGGGVRGWAVLLAEHLRQVSPEMSFTNLA